MIGYWHFGPTVLASFAASLVECVEALTVILAVGVVRGWRWALIGTGAALCVLVALVVLFGPSLTRIPLSVVQVVIGTLLLLFGLRWLRKAILRFVGAIALHDEAAAYAKETAALRLIATPQRSRWDAVAFAAAFKIVMLEGIEVVFIVIAIGAGGGLWMPAALGAAAALVVVTGAGLALHRPLSTIPENALKFGVGILLTAFGTFWVGEGAGLEWPAGDGSLLLLIVGYLAIAQALVIVGRSVYRAGTARVKPKALGRSTGALATIVGEFWSLFVDDGFLAAGTLLWAGITGWSAGRLPIPMTAQCTVFALGFAGLLGWSVMRAVRR
jgi:uncharacterized membrane protein